MREIRGRERKLRVSLRLKLENARRVGSCTRSEDPSEEGKRKELQLIASHLVAGFELRVRDGIHDGRCLRATSAKWATTETGANEKEGGR